MTRRILKQWIVAGTTVVWSALSFGAEMLPILAQNQQPASAPPKRPAPSYVWETIVVVLVSVAGLYAVCRTSRRQ